MPDKSKLIPTKKPKAIIIASANLLLEGAGCWFGLIRELNISTADHAKLYTDLKKDKISYQKAKKEFLNRVKKINGKVNREELIRIFESFGI